MNNPLQKQNYCSGEMKTLPEAKKELKEKWQLATANKISHIIIMPHLTKKKN